ncbi:MAG: serine/threonine-protein phosphatase [Hyphomicrobiaceae bacterium]|nr:serine/threonine-protein phosphatase [Hyphomicrobiaceae bacterium]
MSFRYATRAAQGARNYQEDAASVRADADALTAVLADGMGGHAGGAVASEVASTAFLHTFHDRAAEDVRVRLARSLDSANAAIAARAAGSPSLAGMGCTLIGAAFQPGQLEWISVGDSPLFLVRRAEITRLNADHSLAPEIDRLAEIGRISWDDAKSDPRRHILRSALTGAEIDLIDGPRAPLALEPDDVVILASDGIHSLVNADIVRIVREAGAPDAAAEALLAAVADAGDPHQDNTTVVVVWVPRDAP